MTDDTTATSTEPTPEGDDPWGGWQPGSPAAEDVLSVHVQPQARADWRFVLSIAPDKAPFLVIRAETAAELNQAFTELEMNGVWANIAAHHQTAKAHATVGAGLGPVAPVQQQAPPQQGGWNAPPAQQGFQPQFGPPLGAGGQPGTAPAAWQNAGAPPVQQQWGGAPQGGGQQGGNNGPKPRPQWPVVFAIEVPFGAKDQFKEFRNQNAQYLRGKVAWGGGGKYWIHGDVVQAFGQYNPQPA